ncbi:MAG: EAL domain-containing protein [Solirubrobacteraceae bacterium]
MSALDATSLISAWRGGEGPSGNGAESDLQFVEGLLAATTGCSLIATDLQGVICFWNEGARKLYGYEPSDIIGRPIFDLDAELPDSAEQSDVLQALYREGTWSGERHRRRKDGTLFPAKVTATQRPDATGKPEGFLFFSTDVSFEVQANADREAARRFAASLVEYAPDSIIIADADGIMTGVNAQTEHIFGYGRNELMGRPVESLLPQRYHEEHINLRAGFMARPGIRSMGEDRQLRALRKNGEEFPVEVSLSPVASPDGPMTIASIRDITDREQTRTQLHDAVVALQAAELHSVVLDTIAEGLMILGPDGAVEHVNAAGASLLGWSVDELRGQAHHACLHFQHADGTPHSEDECPITRAHQEGREIRIADDAFTRKDGTIIPVAYSAAPVRGDTSVRGAVVVFRDITEEQEAAQRSKRELAALTWVGRIREALDEDRFVLFSQPILDIASGEQYSEELLIRMRGRDSDEIIAPGAFLPVAEQYGLIEDIDRWVVSRAVELVAGGRNVEANISANSISTLSILRWIEQELARTGADPSKLTIELTETALMANLQNGQAFANGLAHLGCPLALDDFGTGFGSFTYLQQFPLTYLKIDISFVRDLPANRTNQHLVQSTVMLAKGFELKTIAEGVEDAETLELLKEFGVDYAQGYHLGRPAPSTSPQ